MAPPSPRHSAIAAQIVSLLDHHLDGHPRYQVLVEPRVQLDDYNVRVPDLAVTGKAIGWGVPLLHEPRLIVSIIATSTAPVASYMALQSMSEMLVLESVAVAAALLRRPRDGAWSRQTLGADDMVALASIGLTIPLADVYRPVGLLRHA